MAITHSEQDRDGTVAQQVGGSAAAPATPDSTLTAATPPKTRGDYFTLRTANCVICRAPLPGPPLTVCGHVVTYDGLSVLASYCADHSDVAGTDLHNFGGRQGCLRLWTVADGVLVEDFTEVGE